MVVFTSCLNIVFIESGLPGSGVHLDQVLTCLPQLSLLVLDLLEENRSLALEAPHPVGLSVLLYN